MQKQQQMMLTQKQQTTQQQMMQQFNQFKANFKGDPKAEVEKLLQSGRLNQQQLNQLQQMAKQFQSLMQ